MKSLASVSIGLLAASCGHAAEESRWPYAEAAQACFARTAERIPAIADGSCELCVGKPAPTDFRTDENGRFVMSMADLRESGGRSVIWTCTGSMRSRSIDAVSFQGKTEPPRPNEHWSF